MDNWNVIEILKIGLPGLVFLLSALSFRLLSREQGKEHPNTHVLSSIKTFMCINVVLAGLTLASPIMDKHLSHETDIAGLEPGDRSYVMKARTGVTELTLGVAAVCHNATYINRYVLIQDKVTGQLVQVFTKSVIPCTDTELIALSQDDVDQLGWQPGDDSKEVVVVVSEPGYMFAMGAS